MENNRNFRDRDDFLGVVHLDRDLVQGKPFDFETAAPPLEQHLPACATASKQVEELIASARNKPGRGARVTVLWCYLIAAVFAVSGIVFDFVGIWHVTAFIAPCALGFAAGGFGYMQVA